jgi:hypothetical protein
MRSHHIYVLTVNRMDFAAYTILNSVKEMRSLSIHALSARNEVSSIVSNSVIDKVRSAFFTSALDKAT